MKTARFLVFGLGVLFILNFAQAEDEPSADLVKAQKAMAEKDYDEAFAGYMKAAEDQNDALAQFTVGLFYQNGWGRPASPAKAYVWFEKAALGGIPAAQHFLGDYLVAGVYCKADPAKAALWYEKAAALGHYISLCSLAELYMTGTGVEKNPVKAIALCREAAEKGSVPAQVRLGMFLLDGDESIRDYAEAYRWFEIAAENNLPEAQYYLGVMHRDGLGRPKELKAGRYWFESAASLKYGPAYLPVGELYFNGPVDPNTGKLSAGDLAKAYLWLSAAEREAKEPEEKKQVNELLEKVDRIMPESWKPGLDAKVDAHFSTSNL
ncbi:MAG: tetratricopeptide repeat protein [Phycisphaerae bacterium]|nr:tetratricopeptide repeat protein [Phycisphaerae bacterium]